MYSTKHKLERSNSQLMEARSLQGYRGMGEKRGNLYGDEQHMWFTITTPIVEREANGYNHGS